MIIDSEKGVLRLLETLLIKLGYSHTNKEIEYEKHMKVGSGVNIYADIVISLKSRPVLVIEAKAPNINNLDKALEQGMTYALQLRAKYVIATNGNKLKLLYVDKNEIIYESSLNEKELVFLNKTNMIKHISLNEVLVPLPSYEYFNTWFEFIDYNEMICKWTYRIQELQDIIPKLEGKISKLQYEKIDEDKKIIKLQHENNNLEIILKKNNNAIDKLTEQLSNYKLSIQNVIPELEAEIFKLQYEKNSMGITINDKQNIINDLNKDLNQLKSLINDLNCKIKEVIENNQIKYNEKEMAFKEMNLRSSELIKAYKEEINELSRKKIFYIL